ncbi:MAG: hypothetical protein ACRBFS_02320 [Aureispira sp.]
MELWYYIEQAIIGGLFLLACRQLIQLFRPQTAGGCAKGCGSKCAIGNLEKAMEQFELDLENKSL